MGKAEYNNILAPCLCFEKKSSFRIKSIYELFDVSQRRHDSFQRPWPQIDVSALGFWIFNKFFIEKIKADKTFSHQITYNLQNYFKLNFAPLRFSPKRCQSCLHGRDEPEVSDLEDDKSNKF